VFKNITQQRPFFKKFYLEGIGVCDECIVQRFSTQIAPRPVFLKKNSTTNTREFFANLSEMSYSKQVEKTMSTTNLTISTTCRLRKAGIEY